MRCTCGGVHRRTPRARAGVRSPARRTAGGYWRRRRYAPSRWRRRTTRRSCGRADARPGCPRSACRWRSRRTIETVPKLGSFVRVRPRDVLAGRTACRRRRRGSHDDDGDRLVAVRALLHHGQRGLGGLAQRLGGCLRPGAPPHHAVRGRAARRSLTRHNDCIGARHTNWGAARHLACTSAGGSACGGRTGSGGSVSRGSACGDGPSSGSAEAIPADRNRANESRADRDRADSGGTPKGRTARTGTISGRAGTIGAQDLGAGRGKQGLKPPQRLFLPRGLGLAARGPAHGRGDHLNAVIGRGQHTVGRQRLVTPLPELPPQPVPAKLRVRQRAARVSR